MPDPKATLTFKLDTPSNQRWSGALPIEVRDSEKLVLKARGVSDDALQVPPGRYLVTALLPSGEQATIGDTVIVGPGDHKLLELSLSDLSFPPALESTSTLGDSVREFARPITKYFSSQTYAVVRGNWLADKIPGAEPASVTREPTARTSLEIPFRTEPTWIEITTSNKCHYIAVPVEDGRSTTLQWALDGKTDKLDLKVDFHDGEMNSLLDFIHNDKALEARSISQTLVMRSDIKKQSPLRATLGAYVLLRANQLENLEGWTSDLTSTCGWLPDVLAIRTEYLARTARHQDALKQLLDIPRWGTPLFRSGIGYLADRAKTYMKLAPKKRSGLDIGEADQARLGAIARVFDDLAGALDMSQSMSVLRHVSPV